MKRIIAAVLFGVASLGSISSTQAQVSLSINIGSQPQWGPSGYNHVDYYYLPDIDAYYYVPAQQYIYLNNGSWVWRKTLPARYRNYDLYSAYKVVMNTPKPYLLHQTHIREYSKYKNYRGKQANLRDSRPRTPISGRPNRPVSGPPNRPVTGRPNRPVTVRPNTPDNRRNDQNHRNDQHVDRNNRDNNGRGGDNGDRGGRGR